MIAWRIVKIIQKKALNKELKKPGLTCNPGLVQIILWTTGPWSLEQLKFSIENNPASVPYVIGPGNLGQNL